MLELGLGVVALGGAVLGGAVLGGAVLGGAVLGGAVLGAPLAEPSGVLDPPATNEGGDVDGEPVEHADSDAVATMAKAAQLSTEPRRRGRP